MGVRIPHRSPNFMTVVGVRVTHTPQELNVLMHEGSIFYGKEIQVRVLGRYGHQLWRDAGVDKLASLEVSASETAREFESLSLRQINKA